MSKGKTMKYFLAIALFSILCISCEEEKTESEQIPLSDGAKQWIRNLQGTVYFKSNTGLSDSYEVSGGYTETKLRMEEKPYSYGESYGFYYTGKLSRYHFSMYVTNVYSKEALRCNYSIYSKSDWYEMDFAIGIDTPYKLLKNDRKDVVVSGFIPIQDTTIGQVVYKDLFKVNIDNKSLDSLVVNNMYISKSKGLVAFTLQKSIIWYKE